MFVHIMGSVCFLMYHCLKNQATLNSGSHLVLRHAFLPLCFPCNPFEPLSFSLCLCAPVLRSINTNFLCNLLLYTQITFIFWHGVLTCLSACLPSFPLLLDDGPSHTLCQPSETVPSNAGTSITENKLLLQTQLGQINWCSSQDRCQLKVDCCPSYRFDDPDSTLAENIEFLPNGEGKKPRFTDVSMCSIYGELSTDIAHHK